MQMNNSTLLSAQSLASTFQSAAVKAGIAGFRVASFTLDWSAGATGDFSFEGCDDGASWVPLTVTSVHGDALSIAGSAGTSLVVLANCPGYVRLIYTAGSGSGTVDCDLTVTE